MATSVQRKSPLTMADLKGKVDPDWCPGCGDFGVLSALQKALLELQIPTHNVVTISGIGCSSNLPGYMNTYGMHTLHGRALAVATGLKLANHALTVVVTGGDDRDSAEQPASMAAPAPARNPRRLTTFKCRAA